jgi:hypothetical protein
MAARLEESGFTVEVGTLGVRVRAWGFWNAEIATSFVTRVLELVRAAPRSAPLYIDATQLKPQRDEGQAALREVVNVVSKLGVVRAELVVTNAITRLQLARIIRESGAECWTLRSPATAPGEGE